MKNDKVKLLELLTIQALSDIQKLESYGEVQIEITKQCLDLHRSERWEKEAELDKKLWGEPIPHKATIHHTLKMIRKISLEIEREIL